MKETILFSMGIGSDKELIKKGILFYINHYTKKRKFITNDINIAKKIYFAMN